MDFLLIILSLNDLLTKTKSKNAIISDIKISSTTKSDACFDDELLDRILCTAIRKLESDSPPFYGEMRNYHRSDLG